MEKDPEMVKIKDIDEKHSLYCTKIQGVLLVEYRYIFCIVFRDKLQVNSKQKLSNLKWESLQTRSLETNYNTNIHSYNPKTL
jgi:hypothetical protein